MSIQIGIKLLSTSAKLPTKATTGSAGFDLYADVQTSLEPGEWGVIATGVAVSLPQDMEVQVRSRSGLAAKFGVIVLNAPGTIDSDYTGEIKVILMNHGNERFFINRGDRIAQLVFSKVYPIELAEIGVLPETERGNGGFGSTGK
jgi:dUTP pyrophosphatase